MSFGEKEENLKQGEVFAKAFQMKLSEFAFYETVKARGLTSTKPDMTRYNFGSEDSYEVMIENKKISIMSTSYYGNLLLLETKDWNRNGEYVPNISSSTSLYDYFVLLRLKPSLDNILRNKEFFINR